MGPVSNLLANFGLMRSALKGIHSSSAADVTSTLIENTPYTN